MSKKKYKVISTNAPGVRQIGYQACRLDFKWAGVGGIFKRRIDAELFAESSADWASQFEDAMGYLVCLKKGTRWVVVAQY